MGNKRNRNKSKKLRKAAGLPSAADVIVGGKSIDEMKQEELKSDMDKIQAAIDEEMKKHIHVDDFIDCHFGEEKYARFVLNYFRMPAAMKFDFEEFMKPFKLFADWQGKRYRVTGASRMGDVWLTSKFDQDCGYEHRVFVEEITNWGPEA
jgi:hypothetical protein